MKKILLIEDRTIRQQFFMQETKINLGDYNDVLENCTDNLYTELELQIDNNNFDFMSYDYIISHKSAFGKKNSELLSRLKKICENKNIPLILFSGGISVNYYDNSEAEILELNSKTFYSNNLELFLKALRTGNENLLMLCYGEKWKQNIISNMIEKINKFIDINDKKEVNYSTFSNEVSVENLKSLQYRFYNIDTQNPLIDMNEILKLRDSLYVYLNTANTNYLDSVEKTLNTVLIHNNNIVDLQQFDDFIEFTPSVSEIDEYISKDIIQDLADQEFNVIFIKDNLSSNYLELYGIRTAYHIRLSEELEDKKYVPIVILSDFSSDMLNRFDDMCRILLTKNIFLIRNTKEAIEKSKTIDYRNLSLDEYKNEFLDKIKIERPKDYTDHHSIANEWAIYRWAKELEIVDSLEINEIVKKLSSQLYFKYLKAKYSLLGTIEISSKKRLIRNVNKIRIQRKTPQVKKVLYIDDEYKKGWDAIFKKFFEKKYGYDFKVADIIYKDKNFTDIEELILDEIRLYKPDLIILDMRLVKNDHETNIAVNELSGMKILHSIKNISLDTRLNPGTQVIMLTASGRSDILDEALKDNKIIGYIKKEHPEDITINTKENITKLHNFIDMSEDDFYLKEIWNIQSNILNLDLFKAEKNNQIKVEVGFIFKILNSDIENKLKFSMLTIYKILEIIRDLYIEDKSNKFIDTNSEIKAIYFTNNMYKEYSQNDFINGYDKHYLNSVNAQKYYYSTANKIHAIAYERLAIKDKDIHDYINNINDKRNKYIHPPKKNMKIDVTSDNIIEWFTMLEKIIVSMDKVS